MRKSMMADIASNYDYHSIGEVRSNHIPARRSQLRYDINANSGSPVLHISDDLEAPDERRYWN